MSNAKAERVSRFQKFRERNRQSGGYLLRSVISKKFVSICRALLLFGLCFLIIQPILTRVSSSFMEERDLYDTTIISIPRHVTMENYKHVFAMTNMDATYRVTLFGRELFKIPHFPVSMFNTLWVALLVSLCQVAACTLVAYGFARYDFPLKKFWFACVVVVIIIPPQTLATALYVFFSNFDIFGIIKATTGKAVNLRGNLLPYVMMSLTCMGLKDGLYIYMLRQYFRGVPKSLEEAAYVDGCGTLHTFVKVMLPDAMPIITSCFLFAFVWQWTDLFYSRNFLSFMSLYSVELSNILTKMSRYFSADVSKAVVVPVGRQMQLVAVGVLVCSIPLIILYCFAQRNFVESLAMSGSKE